jgi:hypothetical protein
MGLPVVGCNETQALGVQAEPPERTRRPAVLAIAHDGMADGGELDADLPAPPRAEGELEQRGVLPVSDHPVAGDAVLPSGPDVG